MMMFQSMPLTGVFSRRALSVFAFAGVMSTLSLTTAASVNGKDRLTIKVSPAFSSRAPGSLHVRVRVEPHPDNRLLEIIADSEQFGRTSQIQLDGDESPITFERDLHELPGGDYEVTAVLRDQRGRQAALATAKALILAPGMTPPAGPVDPSVP